MAKGGGGAWKVAYADFVTAMMAFFLVMWICAQDQKIKQAIARYFVTPMGIMETGASKKPDRAGAIFPSPTSGAVPESEAVSMGRGRISHKMPEDISSNATKAVSDWLLTNDMAGDYWQTQAQLAREWAQMSKDLLDKSGSIEEAATQRLARQLRDQLTRNVQSEHNHLSQNLLAQILSEVNWTELAEDLLASHSDSATKPTHESLRFPPASVIR
jgi:flagellar motor protein MotB